MSKAISILPPSLPPFGVNREQAAELVGVGCSKFDQMVEDGRMPKPIHIDNRRVYDVDDVKRAFKALDGGMENNDANEWDEVLT